MILLRRKLDIMLQAAAAVAGRNALDVAGYVKLEPMSLAGRSHAVILDPTLNHSGALTLYRQTGQII
jgi:hypothetical protein